MESGVETLSEGPWGFIFTSSPHVDYMNKLFHKTSQLYHNN